LSSEAGLFFGLYETYGLNGFWAFVLVTLLMGGAAAVASGRAVADAWAWPGLIVIYAAILGLAVRFIQYALFEQPLLSLPNYLIDTALLLAFAALGYRLRRATQMTRQYPWLYRRLGPVAWRTAKAGD
jgi:hypothetical protein